MNIKGGKTMCRKIVIAGGRDFDDFEGMSKILDKIDWGPEDEIVSGTADGADTLGERYALVNEIKVKKFPAKWNQFGRKAGFLRNEEMARYCTGGIIFWDGKSKGSRSMIYLLNKESKPCKVVKYKVVNKEDK